MFLLTHFMLLTSFYTHWKHNKTIGFLMFSRGTEKQVVHLRRNEYNSQFDFFVEMNIMAINEKNFKISQNDYYDQS